MIYREATQDDIDEMIEIRLALPDVSSIEDLYITREQVNTYLTKRGRGWVCEIKKKIAGFIIVDLQDHTMWVFCVRQDYEKRGIGKKLFKVMVDWYFANTDDPIWVGTAPNTRAEMFCRNSGWTEDFTKKSGEIVFRYTKDDWRKAYEKN